MFSVWMTYNTPTATVVFIQEAHELGTARMKAAIPGAPYEFKEVCPRVTGRSRSDLTKRRPTISRASALLRSPEEATLIPPGQPSTVARPQFLSVEARVGAAAHRDQAFGDERAVEPSSGTTSATVPSAPS
jgi:hypothetical protein